MPMCSSRSSARCVRRAMSEALLYQFCTKLKDKTRTCRADTLFSSFPDEKHISSCKGSGTDARRRCSSTICCRALPNPGICSKFHCCLLKQRRCRQYSDKRSFPFQLPLSCLRGFALPLVRVFIGWRTLLYLRQRIRIVADFT